MAAGLGLSSTVLPLISDLLASHLRNTYPPRGMAIMTRHLSGFAVSERCIGWKMCRWVDGCCLAGAQVWPEGLCGVEFKVEGFSHKLPLLVASVAQQLVHLQVLPGPLPCAPRGHFKSCGWPEHKPATCCSSPMLRAQHRQKAFQCIVARSYRVFRSGACAILNMGFFHFCKGPDRV